jgi:hypothetical protein
VEAEQLALLVVDVGGVGRDNGAVGAPEQGISSTVR